jgi:phage tail-like protein
VAQRDDPYGAANFVVEIDGVPTLGFSVVILPEGRLDEVEYRNGGDTDRQPRTLLERPHATNAVLRRGVDGSMALFEWWRQSRDGQPGIARNISVTLLDEQRQPQLVWRLHNCRPAAQGYTPLDAASDGPLIEWIELVVERVDVEGLP